MDLEEHADALVGMNVECSLYLRKHHPIEDYPAFYNEMDCLLITSSTEAGPLTLFEALATGIPVVSTPTGWAPILAAKSPESILLADAPEGLAAHLTVANASRHAAFDRRFQIAQLAAEPRLDTWCSQVLDLAVSLVPYTEG